MAVTGDIQGWVRLGKLPTHRWMEFCMGVTDDIQGEWVIWYDGPFTADFQVFQGISDGFCQTKTRVQKFENAPFSFGMKRTEM